MSKRKKIFWIVFFGFHIFYFVSAVYVDSVYADGDGVFQLARTAKYIPYVKYMTFISLLLAILCYFMMQMLGKSGDKEQLLLKQENNELKAKLFDLQESAKGLSPSTEGSAEEPTE